MAFARYANANNSGISINNSGDITATTTSTNPALATAAGIWAETEGYTGKNPVTINNSGGITATSTGFALGIYVETDGGNSPITINNSGDITAMSTGRRANGIRAYAEAEYGDNSPITINNWGDITATNASSANASYAVGIFAESENEYGYTGQSPITINNWGDITATSASGNAAGIYAETDIYSDITINNSGDITARSAGGQAAGIYAVAGDDGPNGSITINNSGDVTATSTSSTKGAVGLSGISYGANGPVMITNSGNISVTSSTLAAGIGGYSTAASSPITIVNSGRIRTTTTAQVGPYAASWGIRAASNSPITINNSGSVYADGAPNAVVAGIYAASSSGTTIINSGDIGASSQFAIQGVYGPIKIFNTGTITGFVALDADDIFVNQAGGTFEARKTSDFDAYGAGGNDLFVNQAGGTVHTADNANVAETTRFVNLERFENQGLISLQDGAAGDSFTISNTPGGKNLNFIASGNSTLAVDAFLGGPSNSSSDTFTIQGNVSGVTTVQVNNTNSGPGVFNPVGIPVVFVTGATPTGNEFSLAKPIDTGFFDYDLFFTPTGSGHWDLKSYPGAGAHLLPQLVTAAQDIWHQTSSTWFDRTADLRVLLNGGGAPAAYSPGGKSLGEAPKDNLTPAVWARGSGGWLDRDDSASTSAYGRTYNYNLDRDLQTMDFQVGLDMGKRDVLSQGDALVFGMLGGFVQANLDYSNLVRQFDFSGGQVGAYATYLKGGLFVDTLFNAHLYELQTATLGFPNCLDASTLGVRTDTGYRFGSFSGGAFLEPLATIEVMWANIDGFSLGGNTVSFNDDPNVRGRLGLQRRHHHAGLGRDH